MQTLVLFVFLLFATNTSSHLQAQTLSDDKAIKATMALYSHLGKLSDNHILFGHQHATEYGQGWAGTDFTRSDVKSVTGSHPAVIGIDFSRLTGRPDLEIEKTKTVLIKNREATYNRGGVTSVSWHFINPVSPGGFYWVDTVSKPTIKYLVPGGSFNDDYKKILNNIADVAKSAIGKDGKLVPMIFRPFHEFDGD
jgi:mannan endo-1,4-beta-mannosidase